jgi:5-methyltetrahydropteroyltriglutamate--homocysteine methyltransferase
VGSLPTASTSFEEPAFNVYMVEVRDWGIDALHTAIEGLTCASAVHICYGYGIKANVDWKATLGGEWRQYEQTFPALAASRIDEVSLECCNSKVPMDLLGLLAGKAVQIGAIDVATEAIETPDEVASVVAQATNCGMAPMRPEVAWRKLAALGQGAALARQRYG